MEDHTIEGLVTIHLPEKAAFINRPRLNFLPSSVCATTILKSGRV